MMKDSSHNEAGAAREGERDDLIRRRVKAEIRKRMRALRKTTPEGACLERSQRLVERLVVHPTVVAARGVALFWPIVERHEVDLRGLDAALRVRGVAVFYPAIDPETGTMTFRAVDDPAAMEEAGYGFAEPPAAANEAQRGQLDVIVVPALAVDPRGHRIGYGAGYYDRTLPRFAPPATTIAVAFDFQLASELPVVETDVAVDWIATDARVLAREDG